MSIFELLIFSLTFSFQLSIGNSILGQVHTSQRILKGNIAPYGRFSYQVSVQFRGKNVCGGAIVNDKFIITAAHCFANATGFVFNEPIKVVAGVTDLAKVSLYRVTVDVEKVYIPRDFFSYEKSKHGIGDIAVVKLLEPIYENSYIKKLKLPWNNNRLYDGETGVVSGFGWNSIKLQVDSLTKAMHEVGSSDNILRYARAKILDQNSCQKAYVKNITDRHICAQITTTSDEIDGVCSGDSGGPLVIEDDILIGVVQSSPVACNERIKPALYTRVSSYVDFIDKAMKNISDPTIISFKLPVSRNFLKLHVR